MDRIEEIFSDSAKQKWLSSLVGKTYKILPIYEENLSQINVLSVYLDGLIMDVSSMNGLYEERLTDVLVKLWAIRNNLFLEHSDIRRYVFEMIEKIDKARGKEDCQNE